MSVNFDVLERVNETCL